MNLKDYEVEPTEALWCNAFLHGDGYITMGLAEKKGWECHGGWRGPELGSWPYSMYFSRQKGEGYEIVVYVEGDVTKYVCPDLETYYKVMDALAWEQWKFDYRAERYGFEWMKGLTSIEQVPNLQDYPAPKDHVVLIPADEGDHLCLLDGPMTEQDAQKSAAELNIVPGTNAISAHIKDIVMPPDGEGIVKVKLPTGEEPAKEKEAEHANE